MKNKHSFSPNTISCMCPPSNAPHFPTDLLLITIEMKMVLVCSVNHPCNTSVWLTGTTVWHCVLHKPAGAHAVLLTLLLWCTSVCIQSALPFFAGQWKMWSHPLPKPCLLLTSNIMNYIYPGEGMASSKRGLPQRKLYMNTGALWNSDTTCFECVFVMLSRSSINMHNLQISIYGLCTENIWEREDKRAVFIKVCNMFLSTAITHHVRLYKTNYHPKRM